MKQRQTLTTKQSVQADTTDTSAMTTPASESSSITAARVDGNDRCALIATAAYLLAERRSFAPGNELEDWLAAERAVDNRLRETPAIGAG